MAQDLRELFKKERKRKVTMKEGHEARFMAKLGEEIPIQKKESGTKSYGWMRIAVSIAVVLGLGIYLLSRTGDAKTDPNEAVVDTENVTEQPKGISLGDLSPDLKKIESYYVTNINLQLSDLEFTGDNKEMVDGYMLRLSDLDNEYGKLNQELNEMGPNDDTINALIQNLQLRLQLLQKLKTKLNQLKSSKNEQESKNII